MKKIRVAKKDLPMWLVLLLFTMITISPAALFGQTTAAVKNIVIVHGAFADASGWEDVYKILSARGFRVTLVQNHLTSLEDDVAAATRALDRQDGPAVLVGHSWGGTVITQAGVSAKVASLVYVAAFVPQVGESTLDLARTAPPAPENGIMAPDNNGLIYYEKDKFHAGFAADLSKEKADFMYASIAPIAAKAFTTPVTEAAWKTKPSYAIVATDDKSINPLIERTVYKRAGAIVTEINGSHALYVSKPKEVADVIETAAKAVKN